LKVDLIYLFDLTCYVCNELFFLRVCRYASLPATYTALTILCFIFHHLLRTLHSILIFLSWNSLFYNFYYSVYGFQLYSVLFFFFFLFLGLNSRIQSQRPPGRVHTDICDNTRFAVLERNLTLMTKQIPDLNPYNTHPVATQISSEKGVACSLKAEVIKLDLLMHVDAHAHLCAL
jgi:hypothetical protein